MKMTKTVEDKVEDILRNFGIKTPVVPTTRMLDRLGIGLRSVNMGNTVTLSRTVIEKSRNGDETVVVIETNTEVPMENQHFGVAREFGRYVLTGQIRAGETRMDNLILPELDEEGRYITRFADCLIMPQSMKKLTRGLSDEELGRMFLAPPATVYRQKWYR